MAMIDALVRSQLGDRQERDLLDRFVIDSALRRDIDETVSRGEFAMALGICLFDGLLASVPSGAAYVADQNNVGGRILFDHGAVRTILLPDSPTGALPAGEASFRRILEPLGYSVAGLYPLPRLRMTGRAYCHVDFPEAIPQYFVSELHVDQFDFEFAAVARRIFGQSRDPLGPEANELLRLMSAEACAPFALACVALPQIVAAFGRQHDLPSVGDYEFLLGYSAEAAWIATEGNAFNHATDRVADVDALADRQRELGRPIKERVEVSASGRVRQTAFRADPVQRTLKSATGPVERTVPGSFYEFITRDVDPSSGRLDLGFDSGNATGIFQMTRAA